ncbi:MAG: DNA polymerase III subunit beta [Zetaproteobacteria bacterium]|nr:DNA polymerase III subunit beta [Zetaproteobacteria bacterium]
MQFNILRSTLLSQVQRCHSIIEKKNTEAILSNIFFGIKDHILTLIGTDLQISVFTTTRLEQVDEEGSITVNASKLFEYLKKLNSDDLIKITVKNNFMELKTKNSKFNLITLPADGYPSFPDDETELAFDIDAAELSEMIASTSFSISTDETRKYLTGTFFETGEFGLRAVTTDGHRLSLSQTQSNLNLHVSTSIVPKKTVLEMKKIADDSTGLIHLNIGKRQIRLSTDSIGLTSKVIDANFPTYQDVIPLNHPEEIAISVAQLDQTLRRSMIIANEFTHDVSIQLSEDQLKVVARNNEHEESVETIAIQYAGADFSIGFNAKYICDVLQVIQGDRVRIQFKDETNPVRLLEESHDNHQFIVMPMRI